MDKTQKIVLALLILAILFSAISAFVSFQVLNLNVPYGKTSGNVVGAGSGTIDFVVETSEAEEGSNGG